MFFVSMFFSVFSGFSDEKVMWNQLWWRYKEVFL